jgi:hypothetical protein
MRGLLFAAALGMALFAAGAANALPNVAGRWYVSGKIYYGAQYIQATPTCHFIQNGSQLGGTCTGPNGSGPIEGRVSGNSITWTWSHQATTIIGMTGVTGFEGSFVTPRLIRGWMTSTGTPGRGRFTQSR